MEKCVIEITSITKTYQRNIAKVFDMYLSIQVVHQNKSNFAIRKSHILSNLLYFIVSFFSGCYYVKTRKIRSL